MLIYVKLLKIIWFLFISEVNCIKKTRFVHVKTAGSERTQKNLLECMAKRKHADLCAERCRPAANCQKQSVEKFEIPFNMKK